MPFATVSVTVVAWLPVATAILLAANVSVPSSTTVWGPGTVFTSAWGDTVIERVSVSVRGAPPVLPLSFVTIVRVAVPEKSVAGTNVGRVTAPARTALMLANEPESTIVDVPDPVTDTPPAEAAMSVPFVTLSVTVIVPLPASRSAIDRPVSPIATSSVVA